MPGHNGYLGSGARRYDRKKDPSNNLIKNPWEIQYPMLQDLFAVCL
jgi:hypothetical protein